jgi:hypothetical protein
LIGVSSLRFLLSDSAPKKGGLFVRKVLERKADESDCPDSGELADERLLD